MFIFSPCASTALRLRFDLAKARSPRCALVSLCTFLLFACSAPCLHAQAGSQADNQWSAPLRTGTGTYSATATGVPDWYYPTYDGTLYSWNTDSSLHGSSDLQNNDCFVLVARTAQETPSSAQIKGTITSTRNWSGTGSPPKTVSVLEVSTAFGCGGFEGYQTGTATAMDAFGDPALPFILWSTSPGMQSTGKRLVQVDSSSGVIALSGSVSAAASTPAALDLDSYNHYQGMSYVSGSFDWYVDSRAVTLYRDGAHGETLDADGTVHGDTTYSYAALAALGLGSNTVQNVQVFHPNFSGGWAPNQNYISTGTGPLENISWQWNPQNQSLALGPVDAWDTHSQNIDLGTMFVQGTPQQWFGALDTVKHITVSYTATDLGDNAAATGIYDLRVHDQYDNWRRVDAQGNPLSQDAMGAMGPIVPLASATSPVPCGSVSVSVPETGVNWTLAGINGGGAISATGTVVSVVGKTPTWAGVALSLAGLFAQTAGSQPTDPQLVNSPDQMTQNFLQSAYQENVYNNTALPGQQDQDNLVDADLYKFIQKNIHTQQDWNNLYNGQYNQVSVTATASEKTLSYYFYGNQYDAGGLITTNAPGSIPNRPGGLAWSYQWHRGALSGTPVKPVPPPVS